NGHNSRTGEQPATAAASGAGPAARKEKDGRNTKRVLRDRKADAVTSSLVGCGLPHGGDKLVKECPIAFREATDPWTGSRIRFPFAQLVSKEFCPSTR